MYPQLKLLPGKEANVAFRHPWIFSGALEPIPEGVTHGDLVCVADKKGKILGTGTFSSHSSIAVRVFDFDDAIIDKKWFVKRLKDAETRRTVMGFGPGTQTTGYRLVFGETDGIPGLVVDRYGDVIVLQISTAGLDRLRAEVLEAVVEAYKPKTVIERSDLAARREEGLEGASGVLHGDETGPVEFLEHGMKFSADVMTGQKTGFFLDQKDLRHAITTMAEDRTVLNLFSYTGASGVAALSGGAESVRNVDSSATALAQCAKHAEMNGLDPKLMLTEEADVFQFLGVPAESQYDMVLLDPPALIKSRRDEEDGKKAYHFLNRAAMRLVKDGGIFITSSCSTYMTEDDLAFTLRRASVQSKLKLDVLGVIHQSPDHPSSVYFPESAYLKSYICRVQRSN
jgi:23S rRNA (cytosine1962-C5)-methyltransferase